MIWSWLSFGLGILAGCGVSAAVVLFFLWAAGHAQ